MPQVVVIKTQAGAMKNYNYLVVDSNTRQAVIVDPAWEMDKIVRALNDTRVELKGVLLTHGHPDHTNLAGPIADKYGCPIWMSKAEIAASGFNRNGLVGIDTIPWMVGQMLIQPIFTPGHTPGCTCFLIGDNLFSGDTLFAEGCGLCSDVEAAHDMFASLQKLRTWLKPQTRVFPGHSYGELPGRRLSQLLKDNMYLQFRDKDSFAAFRLRSGQSRAKLFGFQ
jgi:hydroxyacylglutathione hydrolase